MENALISKNTKHNILKLNKLIKILLTGIRTNDKINLLIMLVKKMTKRREKPMKMRQERRNNTSSANNNDYRISDTSSGNNKCSI